MLTFYILFIFCIKISMKLFLSVIINCSMLICQGESI